MPKIAALVKRALREPVLDNLILTAALREFTACVPKLTTLGLTVTSARAGVLSANILIKKIAVPR